jgi:hypothetical protein
MFTDWGAPYTPGRWTYIYVAGWAGEDFLSYEESVEAVLTTIGHEWAHFEQWRLGKPYSESGATRRAKGLVNRWRSSNVDTN